MNNVDDILIMGEPMEAPKPEENKADAPEKDIEVKSEVQKEIDPDQEEIQPEDRNPSITTKEKIEEEKEAKEQELEKDEYGNDLPKKRLYTEDDVNRMMRERIARIKQTQIEQQPPSPPAAKQEGEFQFDENSNLDWQQQLAQFVENVADKRDQRRAQQEVQQREAREEAEFQGKFHEGMSRYQDFVDVMQDKNVTDAMVMGTRAMNDPAAFLYAAAKKHPEELNRIAKLPNPFQQAAEMGKLEERMKKAKVTTKAPSPIHSDRGDAIEKTKERGRDIDSLIHKHAKSRIRR